MNDWLRVNCSKERKTRIVPISDLPGHNVRSSAVLVDTGSTFRQLFAGVRSALPGLFGFRRDKQLAVRYFLKKKRAVSLIVDIFGTSFVARTCPSWPRSMPSKSKGSKPSPRADRGLGPEVLRFRFPSFFTSGLIHKFINRQFLFIFISELSCYKNI